MTDKYHTKAHFIEEVTGSMIAQLYIQHVPRAGEEIRLSGERYYEITRVIHVYDEDAPVNRVNIGVKKAK